jgi:hypothetical protein
MRPGRKLTWILAGLLALTAAGCQPDEPPQAITVESVQVEAGEAIRLTGTSRLPDETCIQTQLYAQQNLQSWWPVDSCGYVRDGAWTLEVPLQTESTTIGLAADLEYQVVAHQKDHPEVQAPIFVFDLATPPEP